MSKRVIVTVSTMVTILEGGILSDAAIMDDGEMEQFRKVADEVKEFYGYHKELVELNEDILFCDYRHPCYPDDICAFFLDTDGSFEQMWVRERNRDDDETITGELLNEPHNTFFGLHKGDSVQIIPSKLEHLTVPLAVLPWLEELIYEDSE